MICCVRFLGDFVRFVGEVFMFFDGVGLSWELVLFV